MSQYCNNCFCCGYYLVPRYKRLVNNIFPSDVQHGLDKNNLERLRFYAVMKPEKLDRCFRYMSEKIARYLRQRNRPYVILGIKAMNDTMKSCYQQLNTFVDYYLATLRLMLEEHSDLELTEHAIESFETYCEIREEAPNYRRTYEFFVDRFTQLCHVDDRENGIQFRCLGLRGHHALIRKTGSEELQNDIWKHMEQIVPSIVFNMEIQSGTSRTSILAETVLRDLLTRTKPNLISICVQPILTHLDLHNKWIPMDFAKYIFSVVMSSIQDHNSYSVIGLLLDHLDKHFHQKKKANIKASIMHVLHDCMVFSAVNGVAGPTMFDGIQQLLKFLKKSFLIERRSNELDEKEFRLAVINGIADFTEKLPDFQMIEIMQFIIAALPMENSASEDSRDVTMQFQLLLLQTIQNITTKKRDRQNPSEKIDPQMISIEPTFPHRIFDPLLKMLSTPEPSIRLIVLEILQSYIDRRQYAEKLREIKIPKNISQLDLPVATQSNGLSDVAFMKKFGRQFLAQLYHCLFMENNNKEIFAAIYCLMNLVTLEAADGDVLVDMIHFCLEIQSILMKMGEKDQRRLTAINHHGIHALIAAYFNVISKYHRMPEFARHVDRVIRYREHRCPSLLPPVTSKESRSLHLRNEYLFNQTTLIEALNRCNYDTSRFHRQFHLDSVSDRTEDDDFDELDAEETINHQTTTHRVIKKSSSRPDVSQQTVATILGVNELPQRHHETDQRLIEDIQTKTFDELKSCANEKQRLKQQRIEQVLNVSRLAEDTAPMSNSDIPMTSFKFPELFTF